MKDKIAQCTELAHAMSQRAVKGIEGLALLEHAVSESGRRLESELAQTRERIAKAIHGLDDLQAQVDGRDQQFHKELSSAEQQALQIERELGAAVQAVRQQSAAVAGKSDQMAAQWQHAFEQCRQDFDELQASARQELDRLEKQTAAWEQALHAMQDDSKKLNERLQKALHAWESEQSRLDAAVDQRLETLKDAYELAVNTAGARMDELESELETLLSDTDTHLELRLVHELAARMQAAAEGFGRDLDKLEQELRELSGTLEGTHRNYRAGLEQSVRPAVQSLASGLLKTAHSLGMA